MGRGEREEEEQLEGAWMAVEAAEVVENMEVILAVVVYKAEMRVEEVEAGLEADQKAVEACERGRVVCQICI